jgi:chemotaxis family two-component system sensor kinase Cph1
MAVPLAGGAPGDALIWLRPEVLREVNWGGNPYESKVVEQAGDRVSLSPRNSFSQWSETVGLTCRRWRGFEREAADDLARNVSDALLRRVEQDNRFAAALQRTVLLDALPQLPDLAVAARYLPSQQVVGGDWYDLIPLPGGSLAVVVGDVAGHGLAVSSVTAQLRHGLRAYLLRDPDPAEALARLNNLVTQLLPSELATVVVAVLDTTAGTMEVASAGHLPILRFSAAGTGWAGARLGPALGVVADAGYRTERLALEPGDGLLLYTDGLVEVRGSSLDERLGRLEGLAAQAAGADLEAVCDQVLAGLPPHSDDATLLALRRR